MCMLAGARTKCGPPFFYILRRRWLYAIYLARKSYTGGRHSSKIFVKIAQNSYNIPIKILFKISGQTSFITSLQFLYISEGEKK